MSGGIRPIDDAWGALAHPARRRLLELVSGPSVPATQLAALLEQSRSATSQHLRVLRDVGLVSETRRGRERRYQLVPAGLDEVREWLVTMDSFWASRLSSLGDLLDSDTAAAESTPRSSGDNR